MTIRGNAFRDIVLRKEDGRGGAIYSDSPSTAIVTIEDNVFSNCSASSSGAIHWSNKEPTLSANYFQKCSASFYADEIGGYGTELSFVPQDIGEALFKGLATSTRVLR